jgi:hypothetical protein
MVGRVNDRAGLKMYLLPVAGSFTGPGESSVFLAPILHHNGWAKPAKMVVSPVIVRIPVAELWNGVEVTVLPFGKDGNSEICRTYSAGNESSVTTLLNEKGCRGLTEAPLTGA